MVDRKARILLSINIVILSFIIGRLLGNIQHYDFKFLVIVGASIFCLASILFSVLAIMPENKKNVLSEEHLKSGIMNPLYYGNFLTMPRESYENAMMAMSTDDDFSHRAMLKEMYQVGSILERKRKFLRYSLIAMAIGICAALLSSIIFRVLVTV